MSGIDWERYAQLCEDRNGPALERFRGALSRAVGVATPQSVSVYTGAMKASLITLLRQMTDLLKQLGEMSDWRCIESGMRKAWFDRLCRIDNLLIAEDYRNTRIRNKPSDREALYEWVGSLQRNSGEIDRLVRRIREEMSCFMREDVPEIVERGCSADSTARHS